MNRRQFMTRAATAASAACVGPGLGLAFPAPARGAECTAPRPGVQLYTIRALLQRDAHAALAALGEFGIAEAELYGLTGREGSQVLGLPVAELKRALDANGLKVPFAHVDGALTNTAAIAELAHALGISTLIVAVPSEFTATVDGRFALAPARSLAQLDALAERLDRAGREYRSHGLAFGYHNHHVDFMPVADVVPYDYLMSRTDPDLMKIEFDVGWLALAGLDPAAYIRRYAGRVIACHLKDYDPAAVTDVPQRKLVEPGAGSVDFAGVLAAMHDAGVRHGFIEIDVAEDPLADIERGNRYLRSLGACI